MKNVPKVNPIFSARFDELIRDSAQKKDGSPNYEAFTRKYIEFSGEQKTSQWIRNMAKGKQKITLDTAHVIGNMLNINPEYLYLESVQYKTPHEQFLAGLKSDLETSDCFDRLLISMGYKISKRETDNPLDDEITLVDTFTFKHIIQENEYDTIRKEILEFINFKFERL